MATVSYDKNTKQYRIIIDESDENNIKKLDYTTNNIDLIGVFLHVSNVKDLKCDKSIRVKLLAAQKKQENLTNTINNSQSYSCNIC
jgi:transcriptional regulator of met regulon